jgi:hypothetical protein
VYAVAVEGSESALLLKKFYSEHQHMEEVSIIGSYCNSMSIHLDGGGGTEIEFLTWTLSPACISDLDWNKNGNFASTRAPFGFGFSLIVFYDLRSVFESRRGEEGV